MEGVNIENIITSAVERSDLTIAHAFSAFVFMCYIDRSHPVLLCIWCIYHNSHQIIQIQLKTAIFCEKRLSLNVEENELMASLLF
jgi:hypothetical protein